MSVTDKSEEKEKREVIELLREQMKVEKEGEKIEDMVKSAFESVVRRVIEMETLEGTIVMTGGVIAYNDTILKILAKHVGTEILTPPDPQLTGAVGAALFAKEAEK